MAQTGGGGAADGGSRGLAGPRRDAPRLALIINQVDYTTLTPLPDTDQEASEIKDSLTKLGFDVTAARDLSVQAAPGHPSFRQVLDDFRRKVSASPGAIVFVYYTGHGMADPSDQGGGENYLLGIDANIRVAADLPPSGIVLSDLKTQFSRAGTKAVIIVLDACRDTPTIARASPRAWCRSPPTTTP
ncbi:MAG: caspase family protein [Asticcacaulis sp.]